MKTRLRVALIVMTNCWLSGVACVANDDFKEVTFETADGLTIDASLFPAEAERIVIFSHGAVFDKDSWYPLARKLKELKVAALPINHRGYGESEGRSRENLHLDVIAAVKFAKERGYSEVAVVGGSMGGAAVLNALAEMEAKPSRALLLAPAGGAPIEGAETRKLFLVAEGDGLRRRVEIVYENSDEPKRLIVFDGDAHAQHVFKTANGEGVEAEMLAFLTDEAGEPTR